MSTANNEQSPEQTADRYTQQPATSDFDSMLERLQVNNGSQPDRIQLVVGAVLAIVGVVVIIFALQSAHTATDVLVQNERIILAVLGAIIGIIGIVMWARYSMARYMRYWLLRVIYEERLQQDRTLEVLERIADK